MPPAVSAKRNASGDAARRDQGASKRPRTERGAKWAVGDHATVFSSDDFMRYRVKVLDLKGGKGKQQCLVHFLGWSAKYDRWVKETDLDEDDATITQGGRHEHDEDQEFAIEKILDMRTRKEKGKEVREYLISWWGYSAKFNSWEPEENLGSAEEALEAFLAKRQSKKDTTKKETSKKETHAKNAPTGSSAKRKKRKASIATPPEVPLTVDEVGVAFAGVCREAAVEASDFFPSKVSRGAAFEHTISSYVFAPFGPFGSGFYRRPRESSGDAGPGFSEPHTEVGADMNVDENMCDSDGSASSDEGANPIVLLDGEDVLVDASPSEKRQHSITCKRILASDRVKDACKKGADSYVFTLSVLNGLPDGPKDAAKIAWFEQDLIALREEVPNFRVVARSHFSSRIKRIVEVGRKLGIKLHVIHPMLSMEDVEQTVRDFHETKGGPKLFVAAIRDGSTMMPITTATRVYLFEPSADPQKETEIAGGIVSDGQASGALVRRLCFRDSIETSILALHTRIKRGDTTVRYNHLRPEHIIDILED